jgi:hypothetical protein
VNGPQVRELVDLVDRTGAALDVVQLATREESDLWSCTSVCANAVHAVASLRRCLDVGRRLIELRDGEIPGEDS